MTTRVVRTCSGWCADSRTRCPSPQVELLTHMFTTTSGDPNAEAQLRHMLVKQQRTVARYQAKLALAQVEVRQPAAPRGWWAAVVRGCLTSRCSRAFHNSS